MPRGPLDPRLKAWGTKGCEASPAGRLGVNGISCHWRLVFGSVLARSVSFSLVENGSLERHDVSMIHREGCVVSLPPEPNARSQFVIDQVAAAAFDEPGELRNRHGSGQLRQQVDVVVEPSDFDCDTAGLGAGRSDCGVDLGAKLVVERRLSLVSGPDKMYEQSDVLANHDYLHQSVAPRRRTPPLVIVFCGQSVHLSSLRPYQMPLIFSPRMRAWSPSVPQAFSLGSVNPGSVTPELATTNFPELHPSRQGHLAALCWQVYNRPPAGPVARLPVPPVSAQMNSSERILILGLGGIGYYLAKRLTHDGHAITAIESDPELVRRVDGEVDARLIHGNVLDFNCWRQLRDEGFDYLIAVTDNDAVNMTAAMIAGRCGIRQKIARVRGLQIWEPEALLSQGDLGINLVIRPGELTAQEVVRLLKMRAGNVVIDVADGHMQVLATPVDERSALCRKTLREISALDADFNYRVVAIARGIHTIIPGGDVRIEPHDHVFILVHSINLPRMMKLAGVDEERRGRVMIIGGGLIGARIASLLENTFPVCLIEQDERRAEELSCQLKNTQCLNGDGSDGDTLIQAGLLETDTIITATGDNETNIMTSVLAKHLIADHRGSTVADMEHGRGKTIALVKREEYVVLASSMGADIVLSSKVLAGNEILKYIRRGQLLAVAHMHGCDAEVVELVAETDAPITRKPLQELGGMKDCIIIGSVWRGGEWTIAVGTTRIAAGEKVIGICASRHLPDLQRLFLA